MRKLYEKIRALKDAPHLGRSGRIEGTRSFCSAHALRRRVRVHEQSIEIWRIFHTSQHRRADQ
jgi:plasmid stabilization system protein ParE